MNSSLPLEGHRCHSDIDDSLDEHEMEVRLTPPFIRVKLPGRHVAMSFAPIRGGMVHTSEVLWLGLKEADLRPPVSPESFFYDQLAKHDLPRGAVGMMTSADISKYQLVTKTFGHESVTAIATVGLGNRRRIGDLPGASGAIKPASYGTINILLACKRQLCQEAMMEAMSLMAEARTLAMMEAGLKSPISGGTSTGTGTDCLTVVAPLKGNQGLRYVGKHTPMGHLIGKAVYESVRNGVAEWVERSSVRFSENV